MSEAGARPPVSSARGPHADNLVPHPSLHGFGRVQEVWLDRWE